METLATSPASLRGFLCGAHPLISRRLGDGFCPSVPCTALLNLHNARVHTGFPRQNYPNGSGIFLANSNRAGIAELVERPTAKPGAILTQVRVPGTARDFSLSQLPVQTPSTGLRHPSFNHCRISLRHRVQKTVS